MAFFGLPGGWEWGVILIVVLIIFGPGKLPQLGRSLGTAISGFKETIKGKEEEDDEEKKEPADPDTSA